MITEFGLPIHLQPNENNHHSALSNYIAAYFTVLFLNIEIKRFALSYLCISSYSSYIYFTDIIASIILMQSFRSYESVIKTFNGVRISRRLIIKCQSSYDALSFPVEKLSRTFTYLVNSVNNSLPAYQHFIV